MSLAASPAESEGVRGALAGFLFGATGMIATMYSTQPILPELARDLQTSDAEAGLTVSATIVAIAVGAWVWGPLSDRIGRRRSLILASSLIVLPVLGSALAPSFGWLLAARALQGLCMPGLLIVGVPYVMEAFAARIGARVMGYYVLALIVGGLVGRTGVALITAAAGWRVALGVLAIFPVAASVIMRKTLPPEPASPPRYSAPATALVRLLRNKTLLTATLAASIGLFAFVGVFSFIAFRLEEPPFSFSQEKTSLVFALWLLGGTALLAGRLVERVGWRPIVLIALCLEIVGAVVSLAHSLPFVILGLALVSIGGFALVPAAHIGVARSTDVDRGLAAAIYFSAYYTLSALGAYLPGIAWERSAWPGVVWTAVLALSVPSLVLAWQVARRLKLAKQSVGRVGRAQRESRGG